jgi:hypothetical protein
MYKILQQAAYEFITLEHLKAYLKIEHDDEDYFLEQALRSSIEFAERFLNIALTLKSIEFSYDNVYGALRLLPLHPFKQLTKVTCEQEDVTRRCYIGQHQRGICSKVHGKLVVCYECGLTKDEVPSSIVQGVLAHASSIFERQVVDSNFLADIVNYYKPFKIILI